MTDPGAPWSLEIKPLAPAIPRKGCKGCYGCGTRRLRRATMVELGRQRSRQYFSLGRRRAEGQLMARQAPFAVHGEGEAFGTLVDRSSAAGRGASLAAWVACRRGSRKVVAPPLGCTSGHIKSANRIPSSEYPVPPARSHGAHRAPGLPAWRLVGTTQLRCICAAPCWSARQPRTTS